MDEMDRRRVKQVQYNEAHNITPKTIVKAIHELEEFQYDAKRTELTGLFRDAGPQYFAKDKLPGLIKDLENQMKEAADALDYELAAVIRDRIIEIRDMMVRPGKKRRGPPKAAKRD
jgi:excinuclease ABC subunit B